MLAIRLETPVIPHGEASLLELWRQQAIARVADSQLQLVRRPNRYRTERQGECDIYSPADYPEQAKDRHAREDQPLSCLQRHPAKRTRLDLRPSSEARLGQQQPACCRGCGYYPERAASSPLPDDAGAFPEGEQEEELGRCDDRTSPSGRESDVRNRSRSELTLEYDGISAKNRVRIWNIRHPMSLNPVALRRGSGMLRLGRVRLKKSTALTLAAIHLLLIAFPPERALADQPTSVGVQRAISDFATVVPSAHSSEAQSYLSLDHSALTSLYSRLSYFDTLIAETSELFDALRQEFATWERTWLKAVTYETLSATVEAGLYTAFFGGSLLTVGGVFVLTFASSTMVYVGHEYVWHYLSPPHISSATPERIAVKAATYRALSMLKTFTLGRILSSASAASDSVTFAFSVAAFDTMLYGVIEYYFETALDNRRDRKTLRAIAH